MKIACVKRTGKIQPLSDFLKKCVNRLKISSKEAFNSNELTVFQRYSSIPIIILEITLLLFLLLSGCSEKTEEISAAEFLPPITTTGANTLGCLIDGEPFIAKRPNLTDVEPKKLWFAHFYDSILVVYTTDSKIATEIGLEAIYHTGETEVNLLHNNMIRGVDASSVSKITKEGLEHFYATRTTKGKIKIIRDDEFGISGTFEFEAVGERSGDTLHITHGRFDIPKK